MHQLIPHPVMNHEKNIYQIDMQWDNNSHMHKDTTIYVKKPPRGEE